MSRAYVLDSIELPPRSAYSRLRVEARSRNGRRYIYVIREVQGYDDDDWRVHRGLSFDLGEAGPLIEALRQAMATAAGRPGGPR